MISVEKARMRKVVACIGLFLKGRRSIHEGERRGYIKLSRLVDSGRRESMRYFYELHLHVRIGMYS